MAVEVRTNAKGAQLSATDTADILFIGVGDKGGDTSDQFLGRVTWESSDKAILTLTPSSDQLSARMTTHGLPGRVKVKAVGIDALGRRKEREVDVEVAAAELTDTVDLVMGAIDERPLRVGAPAPSVLKSSRSVAGGVTLPAHGPTAHGPAPEGKVWDAAHSAWIDTTQTKAAGQKWNPSAARWE